LSSINKKHTRGEECAANLKLTVHPKRNHQNYLDTQRVSHSSWPQSPQQNQELEKVKLLTLHIPYPVKTKSLQDQSAVEVVQKL
jgi:hypothetical protein